MSKKRKKFYEHTLCIKMNKIQGIKMASIKGNTHIMHWEITFFSKYLKTKKNLQNYQDSSKDMLMFLHKVFSSEVYLDFQKDRAKWQNSVSNRQRLTSRLPMLFTKDVTIKNKFC